jgi:hypothetical protein
MTRRVAQKITETGCAPLIIVAARRHKTMMVPRFQAGLDAALPAQEDPTPPGMPGSCGSPWKPTPASAGSPRETLRVRKVHSARPHAARRRSRRHSDLPRLRRQRLHHRADPARQWRPDHERLGSRPNQLVARSARACSRRNRLLITPISAGSRLAPAYQRKKIPTSPGMPPGKSRICARTL